MRGKDVAERRADMNSADHANVAIKPPLLFLSALALGCLLSVVVPVGPRLASSDGPVLVGGVALVVAGFVLAAASAYRFRLAGTQVMPNRPASALVTTGPYARTRNPIYIGFVLVYVGLALTLTSVWVLVLLIPTLIVLQHGVVRREEAYLERSFGDAYRRYTARVPRWL